VDSRVIGLDRQRIGLLVAHVKQIGQILAGLLMPATGGRAAEEERHMFERPLMGGEEMIAEVH
jgi:hypothetical protein